MAIQKSTSPTKPEPAATYKNWLCGIMTRAALGKWAWY